MRLNSSTPKWLVVLVVAFSAMSSAVAFEWTPETHTVLIADVNGDGYPDILLRAKRDDVSITIPYDIGIGVALHAEGVNDAILYGQADGSYVLEFNPIATLVGDAAWNPQGWEQTGVNPVIQDFDGDGKKDLLITPLSASGKTIILQSSTGTSPSLAQSQVETNLGSEGIPSRGGLAVSNGNSQTLSGGSYVGKVDGEFSVSASGKANYVTPIVGTPSVAGIAPQLSLVYTGSSANGDLGVGWNLNGVSKISRCPTTIVRDGYVNGVNFNKSDRFCLNGQLLVAINGTYGENETEYRTENESFTKIVSYGGPGYHPERFKVWKKDGEIEEYGNTNNSQLERQKDTKVHSWFVNRIEDREGNYVTFEYSTRKTQGSFSSCIASGTGEHLICKINYTGNGGSLPADSIRFEYEARNDGSVSQAEGLTRATSKRLKHIKTYLSNSIVRRYTLTYSYGKESLASRIIQIDECLADNKCVKPTSFTWEEDTPDVRFTKKQTDVDSTGYANGRAFSNPQYHMADVNGDGRSDFIFTYRDSDELGRVLYLANTDGKSFSKASAKTDSGFRASQIEDDKQQYLTGDVNGDGKADLIWIARKGNDVYRVIYLANTQGNGFTSQGYQIDSDGAYSFYEDGQYLLGDVNGDGRNDLIWAFNANNNVGFAVYHGVENAGKVGFGKAGFVIDDELAPNLYENKQFLAGDVNGDGRTDLVYTFTYLKDLVRVVYLANANGSNFDKLSLEKEGNIVSTFDGLQDIRFLLSDVNGDNRDDLIFTYRNGGRFYNRLYQATAGGTNFKFVSKFDDAPNGHNTNAFVKSQVRMADLNSDGKSDLLYTYSFGTTFGWISYTANTLGNGFQEDESGTLSGASDNFASQEYLLGDINADAKPDLLWVYQEADRDIGRVSLLLPATYPDHIRKITDGFGNETIVDYKYLADTNDSIYTRGKTESYPVRDDNGLSYVVEKVQKSNGIGGLREWTYQYVGAKTHLQGRGFLGFQQRQVTDHETGLVTTETYRQEWPFVGLASSVEVNSGSSPFERNYFHWKQQIIGTGTAERSYRYLKDEAAIKYHPGTSTSMFAGVTVNDFETNYGLLTQETKTIGEGLTGAIGNSFNPDGSFSASNVSGAEKKVVTNYSHNNNVSNWRLGFIGSETITTSASGASTGSITNTYTPWNSSSFVKKSATLFAGTNQQIITTYTSRDKYGNPTAISTVGKDYTGSSLPARSTTIGTYEGGLYPSYSRNAYNHLTDYNYNKNIGVEKQIEDANGNIVDSIYDDFGRLVYSKQADGTDVTTSYSYCSGGCAYQTFTTTERSGSQGAPDVTRYFDSFGREIESRTQDFSGSAVKTLTRYDTQGRVKTVSIPHYSGSAAETEYVYDQLNRVTREDRPDGSVITNTFGSGGSYVTLQTITESVVNPVGANKSITSKKHFNALGQVRKAEDHNGTDTNFTFDVWGNARAITVNNDSSTTITALYNQAGFKEQLVDPNAGTINFDYDAFGNLRQQEQNPGANQQVTLNTYDKLNRILTQIDTINGSTEETGRWEYDTASNGTGLLAEQTGKEFYEEYTYDGLSRLKQRATTLFSKATRKFHYRYDSFSRLYKVAYPGDLTLRSTYNPRGYLQSVTSEKDNKVVWNATSGDKWGNVTDYTLGNGLKTQRSFDNVTGLIDTIKTGTSASSTSIQNNGYRFDSAGNLMRRTFNAGPSIAETFTYDYLNRVRTASTTGLASGTRELSYNYNALGNITSKTGVSDSGGYHYDKTGNAGPHAVTSTVLSGVTTSYGYDAKGNMTTNGNKTLQYNIANKPENIVSSTSSIDFKYGPNRSRFYQRKVEAGNVTETLYFDNGSYEIVKEGNAIRQKAYVGDYLVYQTLQAGVDVKDNAVQLGRKYTYLHRDNLGSTDAVTDGNGQLVTRNLFDPFGLRRDTNAENATPTYLASLSSRTFDTTTQGYTGHEQLDSVGLIHMNGRIYDPTLGRFLSPDEYVQFPHFSQSYNRYSYVLNNPLSYNDPSGEFIPILIWGAVAAYKAYDTYDTVTSGVADLKIVVSDSASTSDKAFASVSLISNVVGVPKFVRDGFGGASRWAINKVKGAKGKVKVDASASKKANKNQSDSNTEKSASGGCGCCFVAGTLVMTPDGFKEIDQLQIGDLVASKNDETGEVDWKPVTETFVFDDDRITWRLRLAGDNGEIQTFEVTDNHPFWVDGQGWIETQELQSGMILTSYDGVTLTVDGVEVLDRSPVTYNIEVADFHTFFAGEQGVWVHNTCACVLENAPKEPGIYHIENETLGVVYTGKAVDVKRRLSASNHSQRKLIDHADSKITVHKVNLGEAAVGGRRDKSRALGVVEQKIMNVENNTPNSINAAGKKSKNKQIALGSKKLERYNNEYRPQIIESTVIKGGE